MSLVEPLVAQELVSSTSGDPRVVSAIRGRFGIVERKLPTYDIVEHDLQGFSTEGGTLRGYFDGSQLQKVRAQLFGETGRDTEEFYFANGEPVFVYRVDERYDRPLSGRVVRLRRDALLLARCARATTSDPKECVAPDAEPNR